MHIVGTAGHVDHGKSALVQRLTGTNPDRWLEEQRRGMTLDLGFAHLSFGNGVEAGIIDVPGHERFLHNMLAGAAGMELLLLVVAADEGVMPQTIEHLQILRYLNVRRSILVVTKSDVLRESELQARVEEIRTSLRDWLPADTPACAVSNVSGDGIEQLRDRIEAELLRLPSRNPDAPAYLPVDRVFALPGHGTIVTGTLMQGSIAVGDRLKLQPSNTDVRIRSLQSFGESKTAVSGGARVAANLPGVAVDEIARGEMLVAPELTPSKAFGVTFDALPEARELLRRRNPVRAYIGSAEILGTLLLDRLSDSGAMSGTLFLTKSTVAYPGTAFVVRRLSPKNVLGGGKIEGEQSEHGQPQIVELLRRRWPALLSSDEIAREANVREAVVQSELQQLHDRGEVIAVSRPSAFADAQSAHVLLDAITRHLADLHKTEPWAMGATSIALARAVDLPETVLVRLLDAFAEDSLIAHRAGYYAHCDHAPALSSEQIEFFERLVPVDASQPFLPTPLPSALAQLKSSRIPGIGKAFDTVLAKGTLIKVNDDLYRGSQIAQIRARLEAYLHERKQITMAEFRDVVGTSRKYAVPLLEWFDARGITVRSGDHRFLRSHSA